MSLFEHNDAWFEQVLRSNQPEEQVRFHIIEAVLARRIRESEALGALGLLSVEEIMTAESADRVERDLLTQIAYHQEYDAPVNECLVREFDLSEKQWDRIAEKLDYRIAPVAQMPIWEQMVHAPQHEPTLGAWDAVELHLLDRIEQAAVHTRESWETCEVQEVPVPEIELEKAEKQLDEKIGRVTKRPLWEQIFIADVIVPLSLWDRVEDRLFTSVTQLTDTPKLGKQPFWYIIEQYASLFKVATVTGAILLSVTAAVIGISAISRQNIALPTMVFQADGTASNQMVQAPVVNAMCSTSQGSSIKLVNSHGMVELRDNSSLAIKRVTQKEVAYRVGFSQVSANVEGSISFYVNKQESRKRFSVETPAYRIQVTGTCFKVEPDLHGSITTRVLEGSVKISGTISGDAVLGAGQYLKFDPEINRYRIYDDGVVMDRSVFEQIPSVDDLSGYRMVTFDCALIEAVVSVDGISRGVTPLTVRLPLGKHSAHITQKGYRSIDTTLTIKETHDGAHLYFALSRREERSEVAERSVVALPPLTVTMEEASTRVSNLFGSAPVIESTSTGLQIPAAPKKPTLAQVYEAARKAEIAGNWRKAVALYKRVFRDPAATPLRREDALFSIGKLQAEHLVEVESAKKVFLTYLALFPEGSFAGESWLRLAELEFKQNQASALHYYQKFFEQFPRHPRCAELQDRVGVIYLQQKQYAQAVTMFEAALSHARLSSLQTRDYAAHLHRALVEDGELIRAASVRSRYLISRN